MKPHDFSKWYVLIMGSKVTFNTCLIQLTLVVKNHISMYKSMI
jgi:hypothetical protein